MTSLLLATTNSGKIKEFQNLLSSSCKCLVPNPPVPQVIEDGQTYQENALKKAHSFFATYRVPVLADDSGLEIDLLKGAPGILSARMGGEKISWSERFAFLMNQLSSYPPEQWNAQFRCVLCLYDFSGPHFFEGTCPGKIVPYSTGTKGFGYDPIFFSFDLQKTFGEASEEEKSQVSHRGRAIQVLKGWLDKNSLRVS